MSSVAQGVKASGKDAQLPREVWLLIGANVLIALGTLVIGFVGARARMGQTAGLYPAEMAASALLLWGFLLAGTLDRGVRAAPPASPADAAS